MIARVDSLLKSENKNDISLQHMEISARQKGTNPWVTFFHYLSHLWTLV